MNEQIEAYVSNIVERITCSKQEKLDVADEMRDHLYSAMHAYIEDGRTDCEAEAAKLAIQEFGETSLIQEKFQQIVDPVYGIFKKLAWVGFTIYSLVVLWIVVIVRMIERIQMHWFSPIKFNSFVRVPENTESFLDFTLWRLNVNFMPFQTIIRYISERDHYNPMIIVHNLVGNTVLLLPLGLLLPFLSKRFKSFTNLVIIAFIASSSVEIVQFVLQIGMADIDDDILNTFGAMIGYSIYLLIKRLLSIRFKASKYRKELVR